MNWKTPKVDVSESIHFEDDYVVHGRGFTIGDDIWYDEFAVYGGHIRLWNNVIVEEYDRFKETKKWPTRINYPDDDILYWSITGEGVFILQYPVVEHMDRGHIDMLVDTLDEIGFPDDAAVSFQSLPQGSSHISEIVNGHATAKMESLDAGSVRTAGPGNLEDSI